MFDAIKVKYDWVSWIRKYFEENRYISSGRINFGYDWEIHPVFRWALQPEGIDCDLMIFK